MVKSLFRNIRETLRKITQPQERKSQDHKNEESRDRPRKDPAPTSSAPQRADHQENRKKQQGKDLKTIPDEAQANRKRRPRKRKPSQQKETTPAPQATATQEAWDATRFHVPEAEDKTRFHDLDLPDTIMHAVSDLEFQYCTPIQAEILPHTLKGRDASGQAQTGTGKTAAFLITVLARMIRNPIQGKRQPGTPRVLILAPTRELVIQIAEEAETLAKYTPCNVVTVFGGMDYQKQRRQLESAVDIVVATPGRLIDFFQHKDIDLGRVEILVIDEADRMVDMGFMPQVRRIVRQAPRKEERQTLFFSATITGDVERLSWQWTRDPVTVEIEPEQVETASVDQIVYLVTTEEKTALLYNILKRKDLKRVIVFCNRRDETDRVAGLLQKYNINCSLISGQVPQKKRLRVLEGFREGNIAVLVATDVAGRGLHIEGISHVINYTLPQDPENYVHRIGRTGRAGAVGTSISFACEEDSFYLPAIEEFIGHSLSCTHPEPDWLKLPPPPESSPAQKNNKRRRKPRKRKPRSRKPKMADSETR